MKASSTRKKFFDYFTSYQHVKFDSSPIFLEADSTLLFVNAGMNQFKNIFLSKEQARYSRVVNTQKCLRVSGKHNDLDEVGYDHYHHTFFEMLGCWSFNDYYKKEAVELAWNFITQELSLPKDRLYVTVLKDDEETFKTWQENTDVDKEKLLKEKEKHNFWAIGETGPCGPCTEIHYDFGADQCSLKDKEHYCGVNGDCGRYIEIWNIVFISYNRLDDGTLQELSEKFVDTGMGLERLLRVLQNKSSNYEIDLFYNYIQYLEQLTGYQYKQNEDYDIAMRVISDHIRALVFSISDGVIPSNTGRGYVIRRILRRASRYGKLLGLSDPFLYKMVPLVVQNMKDEFSELINLEKSIQEIIKKEEERFLETLDKGLKIFEKEVSHLKSKSYISGDIAFLLYDTYGFPIDLTEILAKERNLKINIKEFEKKMEEQKKQSLDAHQVKKQVMKKQEWNILKTQEKSEFVGYHQTCLQKAQVLRYAHLNDEQMAIIFDKTVFYPEMGGQIPDYGKISSNNVEFEVYDVQKQDDLIVHYINLNQQQFHPNGDFDLQIDIIRRDRAKKHHTGIHLLNAVLAEVLNMPDLLYTSNSVTADYLSCDFVHDKLTQDQIFLIDQRMNEYIQQNVPVLTHIMPLEEAYKLDVRGRFESKYKDIVRVVDIQGLDISLCGGTHVQHLGEIGSFKLLTDVSAGSGTRRIHAVCGMAAWEYFYRLYTDTKNASLDLRISPEELAQKSLLLLQENKELKKQLKNNSHSSKGQQNYNIDDIQQISLIKDIPTFAFSLVNYSVQDLAQIAKLMEKKYEDCIVILFTKLENKILYRISITKKAIENGILLITIVKKINSFMDGKGGGKDFFATGSVLKEWNQEIQTLLIDSLKKEV